MYPLGFNQQNKALSQIPENQFLNCKLDAFCTRHDVNNVKERRNAGNFAPL